MANNQFMGSIGTDGKIYQGYGSQVQEVGVTIQTYNDLQNAFNEINTAFEEAMSKAETIMTERDKYKDMLIENGIIQKEKTPEEMHNEMMSFMKEMSSSISVLNQEFSTIKGEVESLKNGLGGA